MKKIIALALVLSLFAVLAACTHVTRISIENSVQIKLEKAGSGMAVMLSDSKSVRRLTDVVCRSLSRRRIIPEIPGTTSSAGWMPMGIPSLQWSWPVPRFAGREIATTWVLVWI